MNEYPSYRIFSLGDSAITLDFGNVIDETINRKIIALFHSLNEEPLPDMLEAVPAYSSLTVYYDVFKLKKSATPNVTVWEWMKSQLEKRLQEPLTEEDSLSRSVKIPVCYDKEFALDIDEIASTKNISVEEIIQIHISKTYRVYMLGFLPGFPYMGETDERIKMPRKIQPRQRVEAGSVGIAGKQTGIYPLASPGGWQVIGRTPLKLFEVHPKTHEDTVYDKSICFLHPGDEVIFHSISKDEFENY
jgi:inhibitor of KinA